MLADDIARHRGDFPDISDTVKFVFTSNAVAGMSEIWRRASADPAGWSPQLPFSSCLIEFEARDLMDAEAASLFLRIGFLVEEDNVDQEGEKCFRVRPFYKCKSGDIKTAEGCYVRWTVKGACWAPLSEDKRLIHVHGLHASHVLAALFSINTRHFLEQTHIDTTVSNRKRAKHGQPPLFSHHVCTLRRNAFAGPMAKGGIGKGQPVRAHLVRGHENHRFEYGGNGERKNVRLKWWVWPFEKGDRSVGYVSKEYRVS
jgi:hypothetical protein